MMKKIGLVVFGILLLCSCARVGTPSGGPKDIVPPVFKGSYPDTLSTNVPLTLKEIQIDFDEYIVLKEASQQIVISPPQKRNPIITPGQSSPKKYISIKFQEDLKPNTTYNINFGESIQDNNEGNKLSLFSYVFSTGEFIDSLSIKGKVLSSISKEVNATTLVALYKPDSTGIDLKEKPYYISKVDSAGTYDLKYLHEGKYELIAFTDENSNLRYDEEEEELAFIDSLVNPLALNTMDLRLSKNKQAFKVIGSKNISKGKLFFEFKGNPKAIDLKPISEAFPENYEWIHKAYSDSAYIGFDDTDLVSENAKVRFKFQLTHKDKVDTISILYDTKQESKLELSMLTNDLVRGSVLQVNATNFIQNIDSKFISVKKDSLLLDKVIIEKDSLTKSRFYIKFPIDFNSNYTVTLLPDAVKDHLKQTNDTLSVDFKTKNKNEYGSLTVNLKNAPKKPFFFQLIHKEDVVKNIYSNDSNIEFKYLRPNTYTFRILVDENENGIWDGGDYSEKKQAEKTYFFNKEVDVRAFWEISETWRIE